MPKFLPAVNLDFIAAQYACSMPVADRLQIENFSEFEKLPDEQLAVLARSNPGAFNVLAARGFEPFKMFLAGALGDRALAEDAAQEALLRAYLNLKRFDPGRKWKTWLYRIGLNCAFSSLRRPRTEPLEFYAADLTTASYFGDSFDDELRSSKLSAALKKLDPCGSELIRLVYWQELSLKEAAARLGLKTNRVRLLLRRTENALRLLLSG